MIIEINGVIISSDDKWIYDLFGIPAVCPADVKDKLAEANGEAVTVTINSDGGEIFAASEIYENLRNYPGNLTIKVVGLAASAASVIACAGYSEIAPTAMLMVHNVSAYGVCGDYRVMDKESETLQKANKAIAAAYTTKTGKPLDEVLKIMDKETWITADEAVEMGLIDKISEAKNNYKLVAAYGSGLLPRAVIDKMKNEKAVIKAQAQLDLLAIKSKEDLFE